MSELLAQVRNLVSRGELQVSAHGFREIAADDILLDDIIGGVHRAVMVEEYPEFGKGPSILVLQQDHEGRPLHVLWGIPKGVESPVVIVTAYRPDPGRWSADFTRRK